MAHVTITDQNFKQQVLDSKLPVIVDFWAEWCPPCKMIDPVINELSNEYEGKIAVGKVNTDENQQMVNELQVMSMPTIMFFKNGEPVKALIGAQSKHTYQQAIEEVLAQ